MAVEGRVGGAVPPVQQRAVHRRAFCVTPALDCSQDGSLINDTLSQGQSFVFTRNKVHMVFNPSCKNTVKLLSFLNNFDPKVRRDGGREEGASPRLPHTHKQVAGVG